MPQNFSMIREMYGNFVVSFSKHQIKSTLRPLKHDSSWKELLEICKDIISEILSTIKNIWNNPIFGPNYANSLNKDTYVSNVIVPLIRATLKNLFYRNSSFIIT